MTVETDITVGCAELPPGMSRSAYFEKLRFLETQLSGPLAPRVAGRWRADAGSKRLALVAPRALCEVHRADPSAEAIAELARSAADVDAAAVVFATPPDLSPSTAHREALRRFFGEIASCERFGGDGGAVRVWRPDGLWVPAAAADFAGELGITLAVDPLAADPLEQGVPEAGELAYARVSGLGGSGRPLRQDDLDRLLEWAAPARRVFLVLATPARWRDAIALQRSLG